MKRFLLKNIVLAAILLIGVLAGMETANSSMKRMAGYKNSSLSSPVHIITKNGGAEIALPEHKIISGTLQEKKKRLQDIMAFNLFSSLGKAMAVSISSAAETALTFVSSFL